MPRRAGRIASSICALSLVFAYLIAGCRDSSQRGAQSQERDLVAAVKSIVLLQTCPRTNGRACVDSVLVLGSRAGSVLRYFPGTKDSTTEVQHYWAMSRDANGEAGRPAFLGDDFGQVFEARYDPRWDNTGPDSVATLFLLRSPVEYLRRSFDCIKGVYQGYMGDYPEDLSKPGNRPPTAGCISSPEDRNSARFEVDQGNRVGSGQFVVEYRVGEKDPRLGYPKSFSLRAWPLPWGVASVRSFFVDTTGMVHFTTQNRHASSADPLVFGCEGFEEPYDCSVGVAERVELTGSRR